MDQALERFSRAAEGAEVALFFYAGHGMEHDGQNRLVPVDAVLEHERDVERQTLALDHVIKAMRGARVRVLLLDACRNNPLAGRMVRSAGGSRSGERGLAPVENAGPGTVIAFATAPGRVASDGAGSNSPFTLALLEKLPQAGEDIRVVLGDVSDSVESATGGRQSPWTNFTGLRGRFLLIRAVVPTQVPVPQPPPADECDRLGQPPQTQLLRIPTYAEGVEFDLMDGAAARVACERAAQRWPEEARFAFQLGRAFARLGQNAGAVRLYRQAADRGYVPAISNLGIMYRDAAGVSRDIPEAVRLFRVAADQEYGPSQYYLGAMYENGTGVERDLAEAVRLYRLSAQQGRPLAQAALNRLSLTW
jgi:hypothetical protein